GGGRGAGASGGCAGELRYAPATDQVDATVADVAICKKWIVGPADNSGSHGRAHPGVLVLGRGAGVDRAVSQLDGGADAVGVDGQARVEPVGPGELGIGLRAADEGAERVDGDARRHVAGLMATHPVTHDEDPVADDGPSLAPR